MKNIDEQIRLLYKEKWLEEARTADKQPFKLGRIYWELADGNIEDVYIPKDAEIRQDSVRFNKFDEYYFSDLYSSFESAVNIHIQRLTKRVETTKEIYEVSERYLKEAKERYGK